MDNQKPKNTSYLAKESGDNTLSNYDNIQSVGVTESASDQPIENQMPEYTSPYSSTQSNTDSLNIQNGQNIPNNSINLGEILKSQPSPTRPSIQPTPIVQKQNLDPFNQIPTQTFPQQTIAPQEETKSVVYEKTVIEKKPSFLLTLLFNFLKSFGCLLFGISIVIAIIVYTINF
jgi:hypothetical protein